MNREFKVGDIVYHEYLKLYGTFIGYMSESNEWCDIEFETEDEAIEQRRVSVYHLKMLPWTHGKRGIIKV